nr:hypothetical protein [Actinomycetota bacterium]
MTTRTPLLTLLATLLLAAPASAATLTNSDGTLTFTGTDVLNRVEFSQPGANEVRVRRVATLDDDPIVASGCTANSAGEDYTCTGVDVVVAHGEGGPDSLDATGLTDLAITLDGGADDDVLDGGAAADTIGGDAGGDTIEGGADDDIVRGGAGGDRVIGDGGADTLNGGDGDDLLTGEDGNDLIRGDAGNDLLFGDAGNDDVTGGTGFDEAIAPPSTPPPVIVVSLDDVANDRLYGDPAELDNVHADVEAVATEFLAFTPVPPSGNDTLTGNAAVNDLAAFSGDDTIDGGAGNDVLRGGEGDDTLRARDGYADLVACGAGADTVEADTLDRLE